MATWSATQAGGALRADAHFTRLPRQRPRCRPTPVSVAQRALRCDNPAAAQPSREQIRASTAPSRRSRAAYVRARAAGASDLATGSPHTPGPLSHPLSRVAALLAAALLCAAAYSFVPGINQALIDALAKSGFTAAFGLIFVSEIGDKTFFIAALLAMRRGKVVVLAGAVAALAFMTAISVALGRLFTKLPDSFSSSLPLGEYCAVALLLFFGVKTLKDALAQPTASDAADNGDGEGEMKEAAEMVQQAEASRQGGWLASFAQTFALIFVAEWGDRSMLATIALGAAQNPVGVFAGAVAGHALATSLAVLGGAILSERISERTLSITGGVMFLVFALATLFGVF